MKPNLVIPLASSYDERNTLGYTATTGGYDQRKINCMYEVAQNSISGKQTLFLSKRPGVTVDAGTYGANTQTPYLAITPPGFSFQGAPWVFVKDGSNNRVVDSSTATTILASADHVPAYVTKTNISGTETIVVQLFKSSDLTQRVYYASTIGSWTEITSSPFANFGKRGKAVHMDGYMFMLGIDNYIHNSDINSVANWSANGIVAKAIEQDYALGLMKHKRFIMAFGEETCEVFINSGNEAGSPLTRVPGMFSRTGLGQMALYTAGMTDYYCQIGDITFFLGKSSYSQLANSLMAFTGDRFEKVSTDHEDKLLRNASVYSLNKVGINGRDAVAMQMTAPGTNPQRWLMFFPASKSWFEWESAYFSPVNSGQYFVGVTNTDKVYYFATSDVWQDASNNYTMTTQFRLPFDDDEYKHMNMCGVQGDTVATTVSVSFNDAGAATYGSARSIDLSAVRKQIHRCGTFKERYVKLTNTSDKAIRLRNFYASVA